MNLSKLYVMQKTLDARIIREKGLQGRDLLPNTVLALQVEIGEVANEWRGFKHWSNDREPRSHKYAKCNCSHGRTIDGKGCDRCAGSGTRSVNPLLEEYVDCLHFLLSIARQLDSKAVESTIYDADINGFGTSHVFTALLHHVGGIELSRDPWHRRQALRISLEIFFALGRQRLGFTPEQIEQAYMDKNAVNHERQTNGY